MSPGHAHRSTNNDIRVSTDTRAYSFDTRKERVNGHALRLSNSLGTCQFGTYTAYPTRVNGHVYSGPFGMRIGSGMCRNAYQTTETTCRMACAHIAEYALIKCMYSTHQWSTLRVHAKSAHKPSHTTTGPTGTHLGNKTHPKRADTHPIDTYHLKYMPFLA